MNHSIDDMRKRAGQALLDAEKEPLANARQKHLDAAQSWEQMARRAEKFRKVDLSRKDAPSGQ